MAKPVSEKLLKNLQTKCELHFEPNPFFIFGVSGGADSMAMLYAFHNLNARGLVVHINYGKRGDESDKDQELVEQMAFSWGFECCSIRLNPEEAEGQNFQDWARKQRYQVFRDLKAEAEADAICTAHHQNDQIETILQKVFRGSSPAAWQGMKVVEKDLFRPFLDISKQQILDFCASEAIPYRTDSSNLESDFARNFIRHRLEKEMNEFFPGWQENILQLPVHGRAFEESMNWIADTVAHEQNIHLAKYRSLPKELKPAFWKVILDRSGHAGDYTKGQLLELAEIESLQTGRVLEIPPFQITKGREIIHIQPAQQKQITPATFTQEQLKKTVSTQGVELGLSATFPDNMPLCLDAEKLSWPVILRLWEPGDGFRPLGMDGHQKVAHHLTNRKIPAHLKEKALVLCGSDGTIYAIIYPVVAANGERGAISELAKIKFKSQTYLTINFT